MATQIISVLILCFDWIGCRLCAIPSTYPHQCVGPLCAHDSPSCAAVASSCWWFCCCGSVVGTTGLCNGWKGWKCGQGKCIHNYKLNPIGNSSNRKKNCHFIPFWIDVDLCVHWCQIPPSKQSQLIPGIAIRLNRCLHLLDQYGVPHQSEECIRKELWQSKLAATSISVQRSHLVVQSRGLGGVITHAEVVWLFQEVMCLVSSSSSLLKVWLLVITVALWKT